MSKFTDALVVTPLADGKTWVLMGAFGYDRRSERIEVDAGFQTDFASVPRILWMVLPKWGKYGNAAVIHDWLYWKQDHSRAEADRIFLEGMSRLGVSAWTKYLMYYAVRAFGWLGWWRNKEDRAAGFDRVSTENILESIQVSQRPGVSQRIWQYSRDQIMDRVRTVIPESRGKANDLDG